MLSYLLSPVRLDFDKPDSVYSSGNTILYCATICIQLAAFPQPPIVEQEILLLAQLLKRYRLPQKRPKGLWIQEHTRSHENTNFASYEPAKT